MVSDWTLSESHDPFVRRPASFAVLTYEADISYYENANSQTTANQDEQRDLKSLVVYRTLGFKPSRILRFPKEEK